MTLSRRWFLFGIGATAITAAVAPAVLAASPPLAGLAEADYFLNTGKVLPPPKYQGPFLRLHPSQWRHFERDGFNMDLCRLIEPIPTTPKVRRGKR